MLAQVMPEKPLEKPLHGIHVLGRENNPPPPLRRLEGKVAIVTGGARGIGEATARLFAKHGARVVIADVDAKLGELVARALGAAVSFVRCDVSSEADVERLVEWTLARHGQLDVLFNNAGVLGDDQQRRRKSVLDLDAAEFDRVMRVNVMGVALGIKHAARAMLRRGATAAGAACGGAIISTASVAGVMGGLGPHAYTASKHAIVGLTKNAACELGKYGIRVNCISPFGVATSMLVNAWRSTLTDGGDGGDDQNGDEGLSFGLPCEDEVEKMEEFVRGLANLKGPNLRAKDIAEAALFLASDESKYVSGHNLVVDGGVTTSRNCIGL